MKSLENELSPILNVVIKLRETSGTNDKIELLKINKNIPHLQQVFKMTYDPFLKYGVSKTMIDKLESFDINTNESITYDDFIIFLEKLAKSNINDELRLQIATILHCSPNQSMRDLLKCIFTKDLKIGMAAANINKAIPELIPVFGIMRGQKYENHKHKLVGKDIIITEKIDGVRTVAIIDENGNVNFYSRQGKEIIGLSDIEKDIKKMNLKNIVLDGEVTILNKNGLESKDVFKATMEIIGSKTNVKNGLLYNIFDCLSLSAFIQGISKATAINRKKYIEGKWKVACCPEYIKPLPILYYGVYSEDEVNKIHKEILSNGGEGLMLNVPTASYECKRTANLLKVKEMYTCDLQITGFEEGLVGTKLEGTLGAIVVDYKGYTVKVGSGFSEDERDFFWHNKSELIGRIIEVQYFEETQDADGNLSLRFPVYVRLRENDKEVSYD